MFVSALACSQQQPEPKAIQPEADTSRARSERATTTPEPTARPTLPRLEFQTPTAALVYSEGEAPYTQPTPTTVKVNRPTQFSNQPSHIGSTDPIAQLVPKTPEFDQTTPLKLIYEQIDMQQFAINPALPINTILDPNCDYTIRFSNAIRNQYKLRNADDPPVPSNLAVCLDFVHLGGAGEDVGELSVNCGWGFSTVGVEPRQLNSSVGQPQHEVRRFGHVSKFCAKSSLRPHTS